MTKRKKSKAKKAALETKKMRDNAGLLLRVVAHLIQESPQIAAHYAENGDVRIPIPALSADVDVGITVENGFLVIVPAPLPPTEI